MSRAGRAAPGAGAGPLRAFGGNGAAPPPGTAAARRAAVLRAGIAAELPAAIALRHELHADPELSGSEHRTAARVAEALGDAGAPVTAGAGRLLRIGSPGGPCVAVRAELDALPVTEHTGAPWASRNGLMHACGHDVHMAALVALGRAARAAHAAGDLPVPLLAMLQPREEGIPSGAADIVAEGTLAAQRPAAVIGVHVQHQLSAGTVAATAGTVNAATDDVVVTVAGSAGHAGYPQLATDPVAALCQTVVALQQVVSRRADPTHGVVLSIGMLSAGEAANVIPAAATARGTLRTLEEDDRPRLHQAIRDIVEHTCRAHGCRGTVAIERGEPALRNDDALTAASWPWLREAGFALNTSLRSCGADDFSFYTPVAPVLMMFLGSGGPHPLHHPSFLPDDAMVGQVANAMLSGYLGACDLIEGAGTEHLLTGKVGD